MSLNLSTGGDFTPFLKYNAKAGRWFVKNDNGDEVEVQNPRFAIDFDNIKTGWLCFPVASAPQFVWDEQGVRAARPNPIGNAQFKDGFEVMVYGNDPQPALAGQPLGIRQWMSNANAAKGAIKLIHQVYEAARDQHPNQVPVFKCIGVHIIKGAQGDNFEPEFTLEQWVDRSRIAEFEAKANGTEAPPPAPAPGPEDLDDEIPF